MEEIKEAVKNLRAGSRRFRKWFWQFDQERWDEELRRTSRPDVLIPFCGKSIEILMRAD